MASEQLKVYRQLVTESPEADLVELARLAGFKRPELAVKRINEADAKAEQQALEREEEERQGVTPDRSLATRTLRTIARHGTATARVAAAKALIETTPAPLNGKSRVLVVFRGRETDGHQQLAADVDPRVLAAAIEQATTERETAQQGEVRDYAARFALDPEELSLAWELWCNTEARAAGLRVLMLQDPPPSAPQTPVSETVESIDPDPLVSDTSEAPG